MKNKYCFDHIYKSGGTSIDHLFLHYVAPEATVAAYGSARDAIRRYAKKDLISGHFTFFPGELFDATRYYLTILRDPIDRLISHYFFARYDVPPHGTNHIDNLAKQFPIQEYFLLDNSEIQSLVDNYQTGHYSMIEWDGVTALTDQDKLECARKGLERFDFVGVFENLAETADVLCCDLGWELVELPWENKGTRHSLNEQIPQETLEYLREKNQLDVQLYQHARSLFQKKKRDIFNRYVSFRKFANINGVVPLDMQGSPLPPTVHSVETGKAFTEKSEVSGFGSKRVEIQNVAVIGALSQSQTILAGEDMSIQVRMFSHANISDLIVGISIFSTAGDEIYAVNSAYLGANLHSEANTAYVVKFDLRCDIGMGEYRIDASVHRAGVGPDALFHFARDGCRFIVPGNLGGHFEGRNKLYPTFMFAMESSDGEHTILRLDKALHNKLSAEEVAWYGKPLTQVRAELTVISPPPNGIERDSETFIKMKVKNHGSETWPWWGHKAVAFSYHWLHADGSNSDWDGVRTSLPADISGEQELVLDVRILAPLVPGNYILRLTLIQENVRWFDEYGIGKDINVVVV